MDLIILDFKTLAYKDHAYIGDTFDIHTDLVVTQRSTFKVNKSSLSANIGDILYVKGFDTYLGIIENIEDGKTYLTISAVSFKELFKVEVMVKSFNGNLADYIETLINETFIKNTDKAQNLTYLKVVKETSKTGQFLFEDNKVITISEVLELVSKTYGVNTMFDVVFEAGSIKQVLIRIVNISQGIKLKGDLLNLENLVINDSNLEDINKVSYYPKHDNLYFKETIHYFLLKDGSITKDKNHALRFDKVKLKVETYSDNDYLELDTKVKSILNSSSTDHQISFSYLKDKTSLEILRNLKLGDFVEFIYKGKSYDSVVSAMRYQNNTEVCHITLGEYRVKLTEKIQMLSKQVNSKVGNITLSGTTLTDLDGGEF